METSNAAPQFVYEDEDDEEYEPLLVMTMEEYDARYPFPPIDPKSIPQRSEKIDGDFTAIFHEACQARGHKPQFHFEEKVKGFFTVSVTVSGQMLGQIGEYASKRDAKNAICKQYLPQLDTLKSRRTDDKDGQYSAEFNQACQTLGIKPQFIYSEVSKDSFNVALKINQQHVDEIGPYASKKDAKNEICRQYLTKLGGFSGQRKRRGSDLHGSTPTKRRSSVQQGTTTAPSDHLNDEEWIGLVMHYAQSNKLPRPDFQITGLHPSMGPWNSLLQLAGGPPDPIGNPSALYKRKDDAKKATAMQAVLWLREQGKLPQRSSFHNPNKSKASSSSSSSIVPIQHSLPAQDAQSSTLPIRPYLDPSDSTGKQVATLAIALGFTQPEFRVHPRQGAFLDIWAVFTERDTTREPRLQGEIGRVNHVHGKKMAKEECWREVLKVLEEIEQSRLEGMAR